MFTQYNCLRGCTLYSCVLCIFWTSSMIYCSVKICNSTDNSNNISFHKVRENWKELKCWKKNHIEFVQTISNLIVTRRKEEWTHLLSRPCFSHLRLRHHRFKSLANTIILLREHKSWRGGEYKERFKVGEESEQFRAHYFRAENYFSE